MEILSSSLESSDGLFSVDNATDYEDIGYNVDILSIALSDIDGYVAEESKTPSVDIDVGSRSPMRGSKGKPLEAIKGFVDKINYTIGEFTCPFFVSWKSDHRSHSRHASCTS